MSEKVSVKFNGGIPSSINFRCPGVFKTNVKAGDIIEGVSKEIYDSELKDDPRFSLVGEKPLDKKSTNKKEKQTSTEGDN